MKSKFKNFMKVILCDILACIIIVLMSAVVIFLAKIFI